MHTRLWMIVATLFPLVFSDVSAEEVLHVAWPFHWEIRPPVREGGVLQLQARERNEGVTSQLVNLTAVDTRAASKSIDIGSIRELALRLRNAVLKSAVEEEIELVPFKAAQGYY